MEGLSATAKLYLADFASTFAPGAILVLAGFSKLAHLRWFIEAVSKYRLVPRTLTMPVALALTGCEITIGVMLLLGAFKPWPALAAALLFAVLAIVVGRAVVFGDTNRSCGCGIAGDAKLSWRLVVRNLTLIALALLSLEPVRGASPWSPALCAASFLMLVFTVVSDIYDSKRHQTAGDHGASAAANAN